MRRAGKFFGFLGAVGAAIWLLRERLVSLTAPREPQLPQFRTEPTDDNLQEIVGIGPAYHQALADAGITSFADLADADADQVAESLSVPAARLTPWIQQAAMRLADRG